VVRSSASARAASPGVGSRRSRYTPPADVVALPQDAAFEAIQPAERLRLPPVLYAAGAVDLLLAGRRVAIIGTRDPSSDGAARARRLARELVRQAVTVVSGLAKGIDVNAHTAALEGGGRTIAVIGTPLDRAYPAEHAELQELLYREHLVVSQFKVGEQVYRASFLARNKTMARIAHVSVIVEAGETSGSHSQARETLGLGHPLFLMRSVVENKALKWPQEFLARGARVLDRTEQILEAM
jgi:DNA processing protein